ncbi:multidrug effflux MFS transporter [Xanthomonas massiliensis]|uniref:multidrug effflux MFS transporter n=1 Tax=Xanthomonas massiliensis TaxID=1720302 RepID=UPI0008258A49|nr:multidrug effflux MFS transporter [Xanthomonas massiliensis]
MNAPVPSPRRMALLLAALAMFGPFSIDAVFPAFPQLARQLAVEPVAIQQVISVYLLAYALMSLVHGPLSDAWGRRRVILAGLVVFVGASVGCALARDLPTLLAFRALQGMSAGVGMIVGRAAIRDLYQGADAQRLMSQVAMIFGIAPAIAPIIGGWILAAGLGWPAIFWFLVAFSGLLLAASARWLPETLPPPQRMPMAPRQRLGDYLRIGFDPRFQRLAAAAAFNFCGMFLYIASAPAFVMDMLGKDEQGFAWLFIPTIGGMTLGSFLSGRMAGRLAPHLQVRIGYLCCGAAALGAIAYTASVQTIAVPWALLPIFAGGVGMGLIYPVISLAVLDLYPHQRGLASSLQAFTQLTANAVVAGVVSPLLAHDPLWLACGFGGFFLLGWLFWRWDRRACRRERRGRVAADL